MVKPKLEHHGETETYAVLWTEAVVVVVHAAHILHLEEAEDTADA
jgi:hypothetical protein